MLQFTTGPDIPASTFNADETVHQGIEAGLSLDFNDWVQLRQIYTWSDFHFEGDAQFGDNTLPVIPEHVYRAELRIGNERMHVSPVLEWIPEGPYADYANTVQSDGYRPKMAGPCGCPRPLRSARDSDHASSASLQSRCTPLCVCRRS